MSHIYRPLMKLFFAAVLAWLLAGYACGGDDDTGGPTHTAGIPSVAGPQPQPQPAQPLDPSQKPQDGVYEISMSGGKFLGNHLAMPIGESVTIRVTNNDTTVHNMRMAGIDGQFETEDDAVIEPPSIDPQGVGELTFAPPVAGSYTFRCDFHPATMGGQIDAGEPQVTPTPAVTDTPAPSPSGQ
jgi:plastocyanin